MVPSSIFTPMRRTLLEPQAAALGGTAAIDSMRPLPGRTATVTAGSVACGTTTAGGGVVTTGAGVAFSSTDPQPAASARARIGSENATLRIETSC
ncbi:MAG: hypothetical protein ACT4P3_19110 [Betaproteobacteria bacterium]